MALSTVALVMTKFQFTHPGGVRQDGRLAFRFIRMFQFTHPGGVRPDSLRSEGRFRLCFNSRTREGCDPSLSVLYTMALLVSIHAPGRGATNSNDNNDNGTECFNSRTREGCDLIKCSVYYGTPCFNSRTREGCDHYQV